MSEPPLLLACKGCGSAVIEACYALAGLDYRVEMLDIYENPDDRARVVAQNPLGQVPVLILPDGSVMTETAAMVLLAADGRKGGVLAPAPGDALRGRFLHWLIFLVGSIYPSFTYGDVPERYVPADAASALRRTTDRQREAMWRQVEAAAVAPWFLGRRFSAIDVYIWVMRHWRPNSAWFDAETPRLASIGRALDDEPLLQPVRRRNDWT